MKKTFEEFMQWEHAHDYSGTDDAMPGAFDDWLSNLNGEEYMDYAQQYGEYIKSTVRDTITKEIQTWARESIGWKAVQSVDLALTEKFN